MPEGNIERGPNELLRECLRLVLDLARVGIGVLEARSASQRLGGGGYSSVWLTDIAAPLRTPED